MIPEKGIRCCKCKKPIEDITDIVEIPQGEGQFDYAHPPGKCLIVSTSTELFTSRQQNDQFSAEWPAVLAPS